MTDPKLKPCEWKLMPSEPTKEMTEAWWRTHFQHGLPPEATSDRECYRAMYAASPTPPVSMDHRERATEFYYRFVRNSGTMPDLLEALAVGISEAEARGRSQLEKVVEALRLVLPLAKGYAPEGQTYEAKKTCRSWIEAAEEALSSVKVEKDLAKECE